MEKHASWIFLSHSSADIDKIRIIRNEFEKQGQNPLAFHLKCLSTDTIEEKNELENLIKREIDSRDWFVYCESDNALKSKYVQLERQYVESLKTKKIWHIDLNNSTKQIKRDIKKICNDVRVRVIYDHNTEKIIELFAHELKKQDFSVILQNNEKTWIKANTGIDLNFFCTKKTCHNISFEIGTIKKHSNSEYDRSKDNADKYFFRTFPVAEDCEILALLLKRAVTRKDYWDSLAHDVYHRALEQLNHNNYYHPQKAVHLGNTGASHDYCDVWEFKCCGKIVYSDFEPSQYTSSGCCRITDNKSE